MALRKGVSELVLFVVILAVTSLLLVYVKEKSEHVGLSIADKMNKIGQSEEDVIAVASAEAMYRAINCVSVASSENRKTGDWDWYVEPQEKTIFGFEPFNCLEEMKIPKNSLSKYGQVKVECYSEGETDPSGRTGPHCVIKNFQLPQAGEETKLRTALAGYGNPDYVLFYEKVAEEEAEAWRYKGRDFTIAGIVSAGVQNAVLGGLFSIGRLAGVARAEGAVIEILIKKGVITGHTRVGQKAIKFAATQQAAAQVNKDVWKMVAKPGQNVDDIKWWNVIEKRNLNKEVRKRMKEDAEFKAEVKALYRHKNVAQREQELYDNILRRRLISNILKEDVEKATVWRAVKNSGMIKKKMADIGLLEFQIDSLAGVTRREQYTAAQIIAQAKLNGKSSRETLNEVNQKVPRMNGKLTEEDILYINYLMDGAVEDLSKKELKALVDVSRTKEVVDPVLGNADILLKQGDAWVAPKGVNWVVEKLQTSAGRDELVQRLVQNSEGELTEAQARHIVDKLKERVDATANEHSLSLVDNAGAVNREDLYKLPAADLVDDTVDDVIDITEYTVDGVPVTTKPYFDATDQYASRISLGKTIGREMNKAEAKAFFEKMFESLGKKYSALGPEARKALLADYSFRQTMMNSLSIRFAVFDSLEAAEILPSNITIDGQPVDTMTFLQCSSSVYRYAGAAPNLPVLRRLSSNQGSFLESGVYLGTSQTTCAVMAAAYMEMRLSDCHQQPGHSVGVNALGISKAVETWTFERDDAEPYNTDSCEDSLLKFQLEEEANEYYIETTRTPPVGEESWSNVLDTVASARFYAASPCQADIVIRPTLRKCHIELCTPGDPMAIEKWGHTSQDIRDPIYYDHDDNITTPDQQVQYLTTYPLQREQVCGRLNVYSDPETARQMINQEIYSSPLHYLTPSGIIALANLVGVLPIAEDQQVFFDPMRDWLIGFIGVYREVMGAINSGIEAVVNTCNEGNSSGWNPLNWPGMVVEAIGSGLKFVGADFVGDAFQAIGQGAQWIVQLPVSAVCNLGGAVIKVTVNGVTDVFIGTSVIGPAKLELMLMDPYVGNVYTKHKIYRMGDNGRNSVIEVELESGPGKQELNPPNITNLGGINDYRKLDPYAVGTKHCIDRAFPGDVGQYFKQGYQSLTDNPAMIIDEFGDPTNVVDSISIEITPIGDGSNNFCVTNPENAFWFRMGNYVIWIAIDITGDILTGGAWSITGGFVTGMAQVWIADNIDEGSSWPYRDINLERALCGSSSIGDVCQAGGDFLKWGFSSVAGWFS